MFVACLMIAARAWDRFQSPSGAFDFTSSGPYHVARVNDGNALVLDGKITLRLIGVDTASGKQPFAERAADLVRGRVEGRDVTVELDRERKDGEGRILAYVYADGSLLNEELIRAGFSRAEPSFNVERPMATRFRRAEEEARQAGRGIWQRPALSRR